MARTSCSPPPAVCSTTPASSAYTSKEATTPRRTSTTRSGGSHRSADGDRVEVLDLEAKGHETKPPARFTEASLVRRLEELGVGRPSTYASILSTIQDRGYVWKKGSALIPTWTAFATVSLLESHFPTLVDYEFTARMEDELDRIAAGDEESVPWLSRFYFGDEGLRQTVESSYDAIDARKVNSIEVGVTDDGTPVSVRVGRYGPFLQRGEDRSSLPEDLAPDELTLERAVELLDAPSGDKILGTDPDSGLTVLARAGRYGPYVQLGDAEEVEGKPKTVSLFKGMELDELGLDSALRLLSLPRVVGTDPEGQGDPRPQRKVRAIPEAGRGDPQPGR